jgi:hypothetical protein
MTEREKRALAKAELARIRKHPNTRHAAEAWLKDMGVELCDVWFYHPKAGWKLEPQIEDHDTFLETVELSRQRLGARCAMWGDAAGWFVLDSRTGDTKTFPNREAAEMVVIHRGR